jgi:hypothetical protein
MNTNKTEKCQWCKCGELSEIIYLGFGICEKHWVKICDMQIDQVYKKLGIENEISTDVCKQ